LQCAPDVGKRKKRKGKFSIIHHSLRTWEGEKRSEKGEGKGRGEERRLHFPTWGGEGVEKGKKGKTALTLTEPPSFRRGKREGERKDAELLLQQEKEGMKGEERINYHHPYQQRVRREGEEKGRRG